jgi:hypothetical protein
MLDRAARVAVLQCDVEVSGIDSEETKRLPGCAVLRHIGVFFFFE